MKFDPERASELLINNVNRIPVARVIKQLQPEERLQLMYLDKLFFHSNKEHNPVSVNLMLQTNISKEGRDYHDLQVKLYAMYDRRPLYDFLEKSNHWDLEDALE